MQPPMCPKEWSKPCAFGIISDCSRGATCRCARWRIHGLEHLGQVISAGGVRLLPALRPGVRRNARRTGSAVSRQAREGTPGAGIKLGEADARGQSIHVRVTRSWRRSSQGPRFLVVRHDHDDVGPRCLGRLCAHRRQRNNRSRSNRTDLELMAAAYRRKNKENTGSCVGEGQPLPVKRETLQNRQWRDTASDLARGGGIDCPEIRLRFAVPTEAGRRSTAQREVQRFPSREMTNRFRTLRPTRMPSRFAARQRTAGSS